MHHYIVVIVPKGCNIRKETDKRLKMHWQYINVAPYKEYTDEEEIQDLMEEYAPSISKKSKYSQEDLKYLCSKTKEAGFDYQLDDKGIFEWCDFEINPNGGKFDWYKIGGRWNTFVHSGKKISLDKSTPEDKIIQDNSIEAREYTRKIKEDARFIPFAVVTQNGEWLEGDSFENIDIWCKKVVSILETSPTAIVVGCDIHC